MQWRFDHHEECYYINWTQMEVRKSRARHSLKGRLWEQELYETCDTPMGRYYELYKDFPEALEALKRGLRNKVALVQERLQELEVAVCP